VTAPLVSVVVPVHDGERFLAAALESALGQAHPNVEVVVVDDGSSDASAEVAARYPVTLLRQRNEGVAAARNAGVAASGGELIAFLDQDDVWLPHKLSTQVAALAARPELGFVLAHMDVILEPGTPRPDWLAEAALRAPSAAPIPSALMVRRAVFERVGGFDPGYRIACDADWFARARDAGIESDTLDATLLRYRIHDRNGVHERGPMLSELMQVLRAAKRRRPLASVVIPVRNNARFLGAAIESVLAGDFTDHEIIVVDNESDDGSGEVAQRYPVRYVRQRNLGQAGGRNTGIRASRGEFVAFLDSDDEWTPDKLSVQVGHLQAHPQLDFTLCHFRAVLEPGVEKPGWMPAWWLTDGERGALPGAIVARRGAFDRAGLFDPGFEITSDTDWLVRATDAGLRHEVLPQVLLHWRLHGDNTSYRRTELKHDLLRAMRASVARKRAADAPRA
jgi:glycosyltransferase involved in cell wall biosynthesis